MYGNNATLLSVRRTPCKNIQGFILEGNVAVGQPNEISTTPLLEKTSVINRAAVKRPLRHSVLDAKLGFSGLIALVGPMGAGKTTTTAKIAGKLAQESADPVGLISTDTDRPGGSALLTAYAAELGLMATTASSAPDLRDRIARWNCRGPLVIDTRGCGSRDSLAIERLETMLSQTGSQMQRYLVLSATEHPSVARECLTAYNSAQLGGVILTRVDQAAGIGHCLEEIQRSELEVALIGTGERVPQDLMRPSESSLLALQPKRPMLMN
jgi:flagellar biosynthesis protein FlhF